MQNLQNQSWKKTASYVAGSLVLAVVGNALWEWLVAPAASSAGGWFLSVLTLGIESVRDSAYENAARGHTDFPGRMMLVLVASFLLLITVIPLRLFRDLVRGYSDFPLRRLLQIARLIFVVLAMIVYVRSMMYAFTAQAITHFEQSVAIVQPYASPSDALLLRSEYAQIKTKGEYEEVLEKLEAIAVKNDLQLPDADLW